MGNLTENQKKILNNASQKARRLKKEIDMVIKEDKMIEEMEENSKLNCRKQECAGSDERKEALES
jgi:hypothetical protein